jgi:hypothetical protein
LIISRLTVAVVKLSFFLTAVNRYFCNSFFNSTSMSLYEKHKSLIDRAIQGIHERTYYAAYAELPKVYGEEAPAKGALTYKEYLHSKFEELLQGEPLSWKGEEVSPYTRESLGIAVPDLCS